MSLHITISDICTWNLIPTYETNYILLMEPLNIGFHASACPPPYKMRNRFMRCLLVIYKNQKFSGQNTFIHKIFFLSVFFLLLGTSKIYAQENINYTVYANIIYRFTKYIDWPDKNKSGDFVIGIVGDSPLYDEIKNFTVNKTVGNQRIVIKAFPASAASFNCHILFISEDESRKLKKIAALTLKTSTLLVTEAEGLAQKGSCINFNVVNDRLKLEINKNNIEQKNLNIAPELLSLGVIVK
ncbi:MAG TPA: YfiR family protein [Ferruginibacter sp.]|nr:YfiR family protein [Ferruginibacter sp.]